MGQLGVGGTNNTKTEDSTLRKVCTIPKICSFNIKILKIACGFNHSALLSYSGYLYTMGSNEYGKLGVGVEKTVKKNIPCLVHDLQEYFITQVSCGWYHSAAVTEEGKLFTWGRGKLGALGLGSENNFPVPQEVTYFTELEEKITSVSSGMCHMGVCTNSGKLYMWGCNKYGQLGCPDVKNHSLIPSEDMSSKNHIEVS
jgi:alpha-tubulin suppressor-like RCC1 family protein